MKELRFCNPKNAMTRMTELEKASRHSKPDGTSRIAENDNTSTNDSNTASCEKLENPNGHERLTQQHGISTFSSTPLLKGR